MLPKPKSKQNLTLRYIAMALGSESKWSPEKMIKKLLEQVGQKVTCIMYGESINKIVV